MLSGKQEGRRRHLHRQCREVLSDPRSATARLAQDPRLPRRSVLLLLLLLMVVAVHLLLMLALICFTGRDEEPEREAACCSRFDARRCAIEPSSNHIELTMLPSLSVLLLLLFCRWALWHISNRSKPELCRAGCRSREQAQARRHCHREHWQEGRQGFQRRRCQHPRCSVGPACQGRRQAHQASHTASATSRARTPQHSRCSRCVSSPLARSLSRYSWMLIPIQCRHSQT